MSAARLYAVSFRGIVILNKRIEDIAKCGFF